MNNGKGGYTFKINEALATYAYIGVVLPETKLVKGKRLQIRQALLLQLDLYR